MPWTIDPSTGQPVNTDNMPAPPQPVLPQLPQTWNAPDRLANGINPPSPSQLGRPNARPGMGYPAAGIMPPGGGSTPPMTGDPLGSSVGVNSPPGTSLSGPDGQGAGGWQAALNAINPIGSANAAELTPAQLNSNVGANPPLPPVRPTPVPPAAARPNAATPATARAPVTVANPENAFTAAFTGGYKKPPPNPENAFTAAFTGGPTAVDQQHMPWPGGPTVNPTTQYRQPQSVNLGYGVPGVRPPPVQGPIAALAPPQQGPRFTTVPRPNADPGTGGGMLGGVSGPANIGSGYGGARGGGGAPLGTALDLSGLFQHPQPAATPVTNAPVQIPRPVAAPRRTITPAQQVIQHPSLPQVRPGGAAVIKPTWWNPATGGSTVGMGN